MMSQLFLFHMILAFGAGPLPQGWRRCAFRDAILQL